MPRVFLSVAEPSADTSAALLARELRQLRPDVALTGVGGPALAAAGCTLLTDTVANAAMGVAAVFRAWEVTRLLRRIAAEWDAHKPDLLICTDSWSFHVHLCKLAKDRGIPVLYFIAPQTWASRERRVHTLAKVVDRLACILPFEEPYFRRFGVPATYVGHPLWDRLPTPPPAATAPSSPNNPPIVGVLPGSRRSVTRAHWPRLQRVMADLRARIPGIRFRIPLTPASQPIVLAAPLPPDTTAQPDAIDTLIPGCDLCLCVSGTAALHVAAHHVPLIVVYHGNPLLWHLIGRWVVRTRTYSLVNLLSGPPDQITYGHHIAPEYIPWYGSTRPVADHAHRLLTHPDQLATMRAELARVVAPLARPGAARRAAELADQLLPR